MKLAKRILGIVLSLVLIAGVAFGIGSLYKVDAKAEENTTSISENVNDVVSALGAELAGDIDYNDTVYLLAGADGKVSKVLQSGESETEYYEPEVCNCPVEIKISYSLNGESVTPAELAGKSGHVVIKIEYTNKAKELCEIGDKKEPLAVPYIALSGLMLDDDCFSNVTINEGKIIDDGSRIIVAGVALPGLRESLDPEKTAKVLDKLPEYLEIEADTTGFSLTSTYSLVMALNTSNFDLSDFKEIENLGSMIDELTEAMTKLKDGATSLATGSSQVAAAAATAASGGAQLADAAARLSAGLGTLSAESAALRGGAAAVAEASIASAATQLNAAGLNVGTLTIDNYTEKLNAVISSLDKDQVYSQALEAVTAQVEANRGAVEAAVTAAIRENVTATVITGAGFPSVETYNQMVAASMVDATVQATINGTIDAQMASQQVQAMIASNTDSQIQQLINENMGSAAVTSQLDAAAEGLTKVQAAKTQLDSIVTFYQGVNAYTGGVDTAASGSVQLSDSMSQLSTGLTQLSDGTAQLKEGAAALSDGLNTFDKEAITKLADKFGGDTANILSRLTKTLDLGNEAPTGKFIIKTSEVK